MLDKIDRNVLLLSPKFSKQKNYWMEKLSGLKENTRIEFPADSQETHPEIRDTLEKEKIDIPEELSQRIIKLSKESDLSLYLIFMAALKVLIHRYIGNKDIVLASPIYTASVSPDTINSFLFIRDQIDGGMTFKEVLLKVRASTLDAYKNQDYPFDKLLEDLHKKNEIPEPREITHISCSSNQLHDSRNIKSLNKEMNVSLSREEGQLKGQVTYSSHLMEKQYVHRLGNHIIRILEAAMGNIQVTVVEIPMLTDVERHQLVREYNAHEEEYPLHLSVLEIFHQQAKKNPNRTSIVCARSLHQGKGETLLLTNFQLALESRQLAGYIQAKGLQKGDIALLMASPSREFVIGIMAILETKAAFSLLEPGSPYNRIKQRQQELHANYLLFKGALPLQQELEKSLQLIDMENLEIYRDVPAESSEPIKPDPFQTLYVTCTINEDGEYLRIPVNNKNILNYVTWFTRKHNLKSQEKALYSSTFTKGFNFTLFFPSLLRGVELHALPQDWIQIPGAYVHYVRRHQINYISLTASEFREIVHCAPFSERGIPSLKRVLLRNGETVLTEMDTFFHHPDTHGNPISITHLLGPIELTTASIAGETGLENVENMGIQTITGRPIQNTKAYVLDENMELLPFGIAGKIYIGGDGIERKCNNSKLASKFFFCDPFIKGGELIQTGYSARRLPSGEIQVLFIDKDQDEILGNTGDLREVITKILEIDRVTDAFVISCQRHLCAYVVSDTQIDIPLLKQGLISELPPFMVPDYYFQMENLPYKENGKLDLKALPGPEMAVAGGSDIPSASEEIEMKLIAIWQDILDINRNQLGLRSHFFELGGNSLKAIIMVQKIHQQFHVRVPLPELFRKPNIKELAAYIREASEDEYTSVNSAEMREFYPLSSAQKRLYILQHIGTENLSYNVQRFMVLEGKLNPEELNSIFIRLINRHESLRTSFVQIEGEPVQRVHQISDIAFEIEYLEAEEQEAFGLVESFEQTFDLGFPPLMRVGLVKMGPGRHLLMVDMHHIISDGTSNRVLVAEFLKLYQGEELPEFRIQYKDFSQWQNSKPVREMVKKQEEYWLKMFSGKIPVLDLPLDFARPEMQRFEGQSIPFSLGKEETQKLNSLASGNESTLFMVILAIFSVFLSKISGLEDVVIGSGIEGRRHEDLRNVIGIFVNTLALREYPKGEKTFKEFLEEVKISTLEAFENQDYQFDDLVENVVIERDASRNPLFDVMFQFQNLGRQGTTGVKIAGLKSRPLGTSIKRSKFDLTLWGVESKDALSLSFEYSVTLFKKSTIEIMISYFKAIVFSVLEAPGRKLMEIEMGSADEDQVQMEMMQMTDDLEMI
jgi:non-ribosomal peptide synthetase component F/acyl carrier protein